MKETIQDLAKRKCFSSQTAPSQMVMKETPRKRLRMPPTSATMEEEGYSSSSFSTEVYLRPNKVDKLFHLELAIREKMAWVDLKDVGNASPRNRYSR